jgi:cell division protein FtsN
VQSGQTVLLGGLIQQTDTTQDSGVPFLSRIPVFGRLFGTTDRKSARTELIVLITPRIIRNPEDARRVTDEYQTQFESLKPILPTGGATADSETESAPASSEPIPPSSASFAPAAGGEPTASPDAAAPSGEWSVQVASFTNIDDAGRLRVRLQQLGYTSYVRDVATADGVRWRVYAGPVVNRDAADRLRASIADTLHIAGLLIVRR